MRRFLLASCAVLALLGGVTALAQEHQHHAAPDGGDGRQVVDFPPEMRDHTLANMRDHLQALSEILAAMADAKYARAATIASARLGMDSPSAQACKGEPDAAAVQMSRPGDMDHQMSQFMPEGMRKVGLEMHQSASVFAREAGKASKTGNAKAALAALSKLTEQCTSCHAAYRVR
jgi:hypothetical protein